MRGTRHVAWFAVGLTTMAVGCDGGLKKEAAEVIKEIVLAAGEKIATDGLDRSEPERRQYQSTLLIQALAGSAPSGGPSALHGASTLVTFDAFLMTTFAKGLPAVREPGDERLQASYKRLGDRYIDEMSPLRLFLARPTEADVPVEFRAPAEPVGRHRPFTPPAEPQPAKKWSRPAELTARPRVG